MTSVFTISTPNTKNFSMCSDIVNECKTKCNIDMACHVIDHSQSNFGTSGFYEVMLFKVDTIIKELEKPNVKTIIYFDSDIALLKDAVQNMLSELNDNYDILLQRDNTDFCAGMFIAKNTNPVYRLFKTIRIAMDTDRSKYEPYAADQTALNDVISSIHGLRYGFLSDKFTTYGNMSDCLWDGQEFSLPDSTVAFHANFTIGSNNKSKLLKYVRSL